MAEQAIKTLTSKINDLIQLCDQLDKENRALKSEAANWAEERELLIEKTEIARDKVESMIARLKSLEQES